MDSYKDFAISLALEAGKISLQLFLGELPLSSCEVCNFAGHVTEKIPNGQIGP